MTQSRELAVQGADGHLVSRVWQGGGKGCEERVKRVDPGGSVGSCMGV